MALRKLILMRHGQAESANLGGDRERCLTDWGRREVRSVGAQLLSLGWCPDVGIVSSAKRTLQTRDELEGVCDVEWREELGFYLGELRDIELVLKGFGEEGVLMLVGHNPGWSNVASLLTGVRVGLGTAHAALLSVDAASWSEGLQLSGCWELHEVLRAQLS